MFHHKLRVHRSKITVYIYIHAQAKATTDKKRRNFPNMSEKSATSPEEINGTVMQTM